MSDINLITAKIRELASREAQILQAMVHENAAYEGTLDQANADAISGWVWDVNRPNTPLEVSVYAGGELLANVPADALREDLKSEGIGDGRHAFVLRPPLNLTDAGPVWIDVRVAGTNYSLADSPRRMTVKRDDNETL